jgi:perosamine synthetase
MFPSSHPGLAINGGRPVRTAPWLENLTLGNAERKAVLEVIKKGHLSLFEGSHDPQEPFSFWGGPRVRELEQAWSKYYGISYAVCMNSATSGLYAALGALGVGYGDEVIVSPYTMTACAAGVLVYGAIPVFADVELDTGCLDPDSVRDLISPRTKAIVVVHQFGNPAKMDRIMDLAKKHQLKVIEDSAQAHGAKFKGRFVGTFGDIGVFSLNANKTIQVGEGGVCITHDKELRYRLGLIRNHGEAVVGPAHYRNITNIIGFNYRMTELQAAIGIEQLKRLDYLNEARRRFGEYLRSALSRDPFLPMPREIEAQSVCAHYCFTFRYMPEKLDGLSRALLVKALEMEGLCLGQGYVEPLYMQPVYQRKQAFKHGYPFAAPENRGCQMNYERGICPNAETLHSRELITCGVARPPHTQNDIRDIVKAVQKVLLCLEAKINA